MEPPASPESGGSSPRVSADSAASPFPRAPRAVQATKWRSLQQLPDDLHRTMYLKVDADRPVWHRLRTRVKAKQRGSWPLESKYPFLAASLPSPPSYAWSPFPVSTACVLLSRSVFPSLPTSASLASLPCANFLPASLLLSSPKALSCY